MNNNLSSKTKKYSTLKTSLSIYFTFKRALKKACLSRKILLLIRLKFPCTLKVFLFRDLIFRLCVYLHKSDIKAWHSRNYSNYFKPTKMISPVATHFFENYFWDWQNFLRKHYIKFHSVKF